MSSSDEKKFKCEDCGKGYEYQQGLDKHKRQGCKRVTYLKTIMEYYLKLTKDERELLQNFIDVQRSVLDSNDKSKSVKLNRKKDEEWLVNLTPEVIKKGVKQIHKDDMIIYYDNTKYLSVRYNDLFKKCWEYILCGRVKSKSKNLIYYNENDKRCIAEPKDIFQMLYEALKEKIEKYITKKIEKLYTRDTDRYVYGFHLKDFISTNKTRLINDASEKPDSLPSNEESISSGSDSDTSVDSDEKVEEKPKRVFKRTSPHTLRKMMIKEIIDKFNFDTRQLDYLSNEDLKHILSCTEITAPMELNKRLYEVMKSSASNSNSSKSESKSSRIETD